MDNEGNNIPAASKDAPQPFRPRVASLDASRHKQSKTASSDAPRPKDTATTAVSKTQVTKDAPLQAASTSKPTSYSNDALTRGKAKATPKLVPTLSMPRAVASKDATLKVATADVPTAAGPAGPTEAVAMVDPQVTASTSQSGEISMDMSSLKEAISSEAAWTVVKTKVTTSKKRRLKAKAKTMAMRAGVFDAARQLVALDPAVTLRVAAGTSSSNTTSNAPAESKPAPVKRSAKPRGRKKKQPPKQHTNTDVPQAKPQKRTRPDDTVTPTGESKRVRSGQSKSAISASYAEAAATFLANELCVAVMTEPFSDMTQGQADDIRQIIEGKIRDVLMAEPDTSLETDPNDIRFRGRAHFADGVLKTWCHDAYTLAWLNRTVDGIESPITGTKLTVKPQSAIPQKVPCMLFVPGHTGSTESLRTMLQRQNRHLNMKSWILTSERPRQNPDGICLFFRVPEPDVNILKNEERRIFYLMGNLYVRFMNKEAQKDQRAPAAASTSALPPVMTPAPSRPTPSTATLMKDGTTLVRAESPLVLDVTNQREQRSDSPRLTTSDEDCFPYTGGSELSEDCLDSSPVRED